jgi:hypothetical protein
MSIPLFIGLSLAIVLAMQAYIHFTAYQRGV